MKQLFLICAAAAMLFAFAACSHRTVINEPAPTQSAKSEMTYDEAKNIIKNALLNPPTGKRPRNPGVEELASRATDITLSDRRGYCLVDVLQSDGKAFLRFYVEDRAAGERFADAVWRIRRDLKKE